MSIKIKHLTDDPEIMAICEDYWRLSGSSTFAIKVNELAQRRGVSSHELQQLVFKSCEAYIPDACECGAGYPVRSRSWYTGGHIGYGFLCETCRSEKVRAEQARQIEAEARAAEAFSQAVAQARELRRPLKAYSLLDAILVVSLIRTRASEDDDLQINQYPRLDTPLSPTRWMDDEIFTYLQNRQLIVIRGETGFGKRSWYAVDPLPRTDYVAEWMPVLKKDESLLAMAHELGELLSDRESWPRLWKEQVQDLHHKISLHECLQSIVHLLNERRLDMYNPGAATVAAYMYALKFFSPSQIAYLNFLCARHIVDYMKRGADSNRALRILPKRLEKLVAGTQAEGKEWSPEKKPRWSVPPQSFVSQVFFDQALAVGEKGYTEPPPRPSTPDPSLKSMTRPDP